jgi:outer membrane protein OmpA-like peptidoglycan-associated protein
MTMIVISCKSTDHASNFDLQRQVASQDDTTSKQVYITTTKPIDSIDVSKLIYDIWRIRTDEYPEKLLIYARVHDSLGNFVTNMAKPYLKDTTKKYWTSFDERLGKIRIKDAHIPSFDVREYGEKDSIPYNIVLTVDYSGSMAGVLSAIFEGTEIFISLKNDYDSLALTTFTKNYNIKVPLSKNKDSILSQYRANRRKGLGMYSAVFDAIINSIQLLKNTPVGIPRVLVVFTDGDDNYSQLEVADVIRQAKQDSVTVFTVAFGYSKDDDLKTIANNTGGKFYKAYTQKELISIFRDIYMSLRNYYLITYKPPKFWGYHKVRSALNVPGRKDTILAYGEYNSSNLDMTKPDDAFRRPVQFDFDSAVVKPESYYIIDEIVDAMLSHPNLQIEIQGHTDNIGKIDYNQDLSERRAKAVMDLIIKGGIEPKRLRYRGFGMSVPIAPNDTEEGRALNRRTMFLILAK